MFKIGDCIQYGFYNNLKIVNKDDKHYFLSNEKGQIKAVYLSLVNKHGILIDSPSEVFIREYEALCKKHEIFITHSGVDSDYLAAKGNSTKWENLLEKRIKRLKSVDLEK